MMEIDGFHHFTKGAPCKQPYSIRLNVESTSGFGVPCSHQTTWNSAITPIRNPQHPSLRFKKVGTFWSARVGLTHRALAVEDEDGFIWVWIGTHDEYQRMIR